jgi:hypothetical protein
MISENVGMAAATRNLVRTDRERSGPGQDRSGKCSDAENRGEPPFFYTRAFSRERVSTTGQTLALFASRR